MIIKSLSNPVYSSADNSHITCEIDTDTLGVIPFTASANDSEEFGRNLYKSIVAGTYGDIAPYAWSVFATNDAFVSHQSALPDIATQIANLTAALIASNVIASTDLPPAQITAVNNKLSSMGAKPISTLATIATIKTS